MSRSNSTAIHVAAAGFQSIAQPWGLSPALIDDAGPVQDDLAVPAQLPVHTHEVASADAHGAHHPAQASRMGTASSRGTPMGATSSRGPYRGAAAGRRLQGPPIVGAAEDVVEYLTLGPPVAAATVAPSRGLAVARTLVVPRACAGQPQQQ